MSVPNRRNALGWLVDRVTVAPGRGAIEDRVAIEMTNFEPAAHGLIPLPYVPSASAEGDPMPAYVDEEVAA